jgi:mannose-6-phosphate isomerase-like protein (cupin superfamily)
MIEIEVYAAGLREGDLILQLRNQMDLMPRVRYKIDANHDIVYFEADLGREMSLEQITSAFEVIGLEPRLVGQIPEALTATSEVTGNGTTRLV